MSRADGNALFTKGMYAEAIAIYEKLVDDSAALSNAAEACLQLRRFSDAESFARKSLELDEKNGKSRSRLARAMASQNKSVAAHLFLATIADETERAAAHQRLVECEGQLTLFLGKVVVRSNSEDQFGLFAAGDMLPGELVLREKRLCSFGRADVIQDDERAKEVLAFFDSEEGHKVEDALEGVFPRGRGAVPAMLERVTELSAGSERSKSDLWAAAHFFSVLFFSSFEIGLFSLASVFNHSV
jgi:tetratricopeptide (TPR) repeat protein